MPTLAVFPSLRIVGQGASNRKIFQSYPGSLIQGDRILERIQLPTHCIPLKQRGPERACSDECQYPGNPIQPARLPYQRSFVRLLVMGVGVALLYLAVKLLYETNKPLRLGIAAAALWGGFIVVIHGLFYISLGVFGWHRAHPSFIRDSRHNTANQPGQSKPAADHRTSMTPSPD